MTLRLHRTSKFHVLGRVDERQEISFVQPTEKPIACSNDEHNDENEIITISTTNILRIFLDIDEPYTRYMIQRALGRFYNSNMTNIFPVTLGPGQGMEAVELPPDCDFQWSEYERIHWGDVLAGKHGASSYCIRKGLSRKAQLAYFTNRHVCKHPTSILAKCMPSTLVLDTWSVWDDKASLSSNGLADIVIGENTTFPGRNRRQALDACLSQARHAMEKSEKEYQQQSSTSAVEPIWILKPSTINKGVGIRLVYCYEQLVDICWSEPDIREWYEN